MNVAVVGASRNPERYSHRAVLLLQEKGHRPFPVHPGLDEVAGFRVSKTLQDIAEAIDTVTVYLSAKNQGDLGDAVLGIKAKRIIFNPGAENPELEEQLRQAGVEVIEACTLVMLNTGQF
jgi:predicted CoA-binding protein